MTPTSVPKDDFILGVAPLGAPLVALIAFGHQKLAPRAPKVLPMIDKPTKNATKEPPDCEKELPNSSFLGTWPGGLREALTIKGVDTCLNILHLSCAFFKQETHQVQLTSTFFKQETHQVNSSSERPIILQVRWTVGRIFPLIP